MERFYRAIISSTAGILIVSLIILAGGKPAPAQSHAKANPQENVINVVRDATDVPAPVGSRAPGVVRVTLNTIEVTGQLDPATGTT
jgi:hypothetical protein